MRIQYNQNAKADAMLKKFQTVSIVSCLFVMGCATPQSLRQEITPSAYTSSRGSKEVAICIADGFEAGGYAAPVNMRPTREGYALTVATGSSAAGVLVDVLDVPSGSKTNYYVGPMIVTPGMSKTVSECQQGSAR
jgi:hypothetical protein